MHEYLTFDTILIPRKRAAMKQMIDAAWQTSNPDAKEFQRQMFPSGKPTVGEFILRMKIYAVSKLFTDKLP